MDNSNLRPAQGGAEAAMGTANWRNQLQDESRQKMVNKITENLRRHVPVSGQEGIQDLKSIAIRCEEKIYSTATSQSEYLRKISVMMLKIEAKSQHTTPTSLPSDSGGSSKPPTDAGQQPHSTSFRSNQMSSQQSGMSDFQQQQGLLGKQNNLSNLQQQSHQQLMGQQLGQQGNAPGVHQQQQQQLLGPQSGNSGLQSYQFPVRMLQSNKVPMPQKNQQISTAFEGQHSRSQKPQQQLMQQIQSQPGQLQQQLGMQQQQNPLHRDLQQKIQSSGPLLQSQNMIDQQKQQLFQSHRTVLDASSTSVDSIAQMGNVNGGDWQEEVYQKIKAMKEAYFPVLNNMYVKIVNKLQQNDTLPQQPKNEQGEKLKSFKAMLENILTFLQVTKDNVQPTFREKVGGYKNQIISILRTKMAQNPGPQMQQTQQLPSTRINQEPSQISHMQPQENSMSSQVRAMNIRGPANTLQQNNVTNLQNSSLSSLFEDPKASQNMTSSLQFNSNIDPSQGHTSNTMQQVSMQQHVSAPQQVTMNSYTSQNGMRSLQSNFSPLQPNPNMLPCQQLKQQEQRMLQTHQMKKLQQQMLQETKLQQNSQLQAHKMPQMNDMDMKVRQQPAAKEGFQQNQRSIYQQQLNSRSTFPISSPELPQAVSPQILQHFSPEVDQQNLVSSLTKPGTPLQSASSPLIAPSPRTTPSNQSPMPVESEKATSGYSALPSAGAVGHQLPAAALTPAQSLAIGTPGISASPLLAEFTSPDGTHGNVSTVVSGKSSATEQPIDRLLRVIKSMSPHALSAAASDIRSVVSMMDGIAGSAPGSGSRAALGEDLVGTTKGRLQSRDFVTEDGYGGTRKMKRYISATPLNVASSAESVNDSFKHVASVEIPDLESTATLSIKRPRVEV